MKPNIAVVGPGALGCLFAAYLARSGNSVLLLARRAEHARLLSEQGICVHESDGTSFGVHIPATTDPGWVGQCDLILVLVKAYDTGFAARAIAPEVPAGSAVLTLQNGLGNVEVLSRFLPQGRVLAGTTGQGSNLLSEGVVHHGGTGTTWIGLPPGDPEGEAKAEWIARILDEAGLPARVGGDTAGLLWGKLVVNIGINALTAILRVRNGELLSLEPASEVMGAAVAEAMAVAGRLGVRVPYDDPLQEVVRVARLTAANRSSMLQDVERGRRTEVGQINGAVVDAGKALGVPTPVNALLTRLVQSLEQGPEPG